MTFDQSRTVTPRRGVLARLLVFAAMVVLAHGAAVVPVAQAADDPAITEAPKQIITEAASKIVAILKRKDEPAETRITEIEAIAYELFDFTTMSKLVLARKWRKLDKPKRREFVQEFKLHLSRTYGTRLDRYDQENVEVYAAKVEVRDDVSVKSRIIGGQFDGAEISYRLRNKKGEWKIIDVVIEGISLVSNYRSQFSTVLNGGSIDDLIAKLKDKNFVIESGEAEEG